ncbi:DUF6114 domain-containing protein [Streptomyces radiopugnans]|nr:DUF6114 domain-containing protein [Streptomyces radiopugnans]
MEIAAIPLAPMKVMLHQGVAGAASVLLGAVLIVLGLSAWFTPHYRTLTGILTAMIAAAALVLSNLGGFLIGTVAGLIGGGLVFGWQPRTAPAPEPPTPTPLSRGGSVTLSSSRSRTPLSIGAALAAATALTLAGA